MRKQCYFKVVVKRWPSARTGCPQKLADGQDFPLRTTVADQHHGHFTGFIIQLCDQPQLIRPARQTFHVELAKRAVGRRLGWLIILSSLKPSCGIHARTLLLPPGQRLSKANVLGMCSGRFVPRFVCAHHTFFPVKRVTCNSFSRKTLTPRLYDEENPSSHERVQFDMVGYNSSCPNPAPQAKTVSAECRATGRFQNPRRRQLQHAADGEYP